ncbi:hypothetical protein B0J18DRAFT_426963 [Chaetomium sp. MPI-SDFR-AT-0129]|nr:hypothetical protein B0J18DRAFT_426963 [Chaetomium sp. MPI-SDFR-AT-0129]
MESFVPFTVDSAHQDATTGLVLYRIRILVSGTTKVYEGPVIRCLTAPKPPAGASIRIPNDRGRNLSFDTVPAGDWNLGHLSTTSDGTKFVVASTETSALDKSVGLLDAGPGWHDAQFDLIYLLDAFYSHRQLHLDNNGIDANNDIYTSIQCNGHLQALILPSPFPGEYQTPTQNTVIGIWAWQPLISITNGIANESHVYSLLQASDPGLAARFLGHITDNNATRTIGFLLEHVLDVHHPGLGDLDNCRDALRRLHAAGLAFGGRLRRQNFLVKTDGSVLLQGFGGVFETEDDEDFVEDLERLEKVLARVEE